MTETFEEWLLNSVAGVWQEVREDVKQGNVWTEQDTISSFSRLLMPHVRERNNHRVNAEREMKLLSELILIPMKPRYKGECRFLDMALAEVSKEKTPQPLALRAQFEFKYRWKYERANVESGVREDILKILDGNEGWLVWGEEDRPARTEIVFFALIADSWSDHTRASSPSAHNQGILHPNGTPRFSRLTHGEHVPRLTDHKPWQKYFEMHGPFSIESASEDYIHNPNENWALFRILPDGNRERINP